MLALAGDPVGGFTVGVPEGFRGWKNHKNTETPQERKSTSFEVRPRAIPGVVPGPGNHPRQPHLER
jgi:hypothetical protein